MLNVKAKVCFVTGAGSGIGKALSEELARLGAIVILTDVNEAQLNDVLKGLLDQGGKAEAYTLDVTNLELFRMVTKAVFEKHGRIDYLFNNAGIAVMAAFHDHQPEDWNRTIDVNLNGVFNGVNAVYPIMQQQGHGHIVNIASLAGLLPLPGGTAYTASKHAVVGFSLALREEAENFGVDVCVFCPGFVNTPLLTESKVVNMSDRLVKKATHALGKPITTQECVDGLLKGVEANLAVIVVPEVGRWAWRAHRLSPVVLTKGRFIVEKLIKQVAELTR